MCDDKEDGFDQENPGSAGHHDPIGDHDPVCFASACATGGKLKRCDKILELLHELKGYVESTSNMDANTCGACGKRVYEMEKMIADKAVLHKTCFKCAHCNRILSLANFSAINGVLYCKPHFIELFKQKGNYESGFAADKRKSQVS